MLALGLLATAAIDQESSDDASHILHMITSPSSPVSVDTVLKGLF